MLRNTGDITERKPLNVSTPLLCFPAIFSPKRVLFCFCCDEDVGFDCIIDSSYVYCSWMDKICSVCEFRLGYYNVNSLEIQLRNWIYCMIILIDRVYKFLSSHLQSVYSWWLLVLVVATCRTSWWTSIAGESLTLVLQTSYLANHQQGSYKTHKNIKTILDKQQTTGHSGQSGYNRRSFQCPDQCK